MSLHTIKSERVPLPITDEEKMGAAIFLWNYHGEFPVAYSKNAQAPQSRFWYNQAGVWNEFWNIGEYWGGTQGIRDYGKHKFDHNDIYIVESVSDLQNLRLDKVYVRHD